MEQLQNSDNGIEPSASRQKMERDETHGRRAYLINLFLIFIILPPVVSFMLRTVGIDLPSLFNINKTNEGGHSVYGYQLSFLEFWYIQIPLFIYITRNRVLDAGFNQWFTLLFMLPLVNMAIWFWPPKIR